MSDTPKFTEAQMREAIMREVQNILTTDCSEYHFIEAFGEHHLDEADNLTPEAREKITAALKEAKRCNNTAWALAAAVLGYGALRKNILGQLEEAGLKIPKLKKKEDEDATA